MCIHKKDLTELDIYHRILRFKNYMVAMVNKSLIPVHLKVPIYGNVIFFSRGLKYNIELLFFSNYHSTLFTRCSIAFLLNNFNFLCAFYFQGGHLHRLQTIGI